MKNIFNFGIYKESFKQLRVIGCIMTAIIALIAGLIPTSEYIDVINNINMGFYNKDYMSLISSYDIIGIYYFIFIIAAPILTLFSYSFLTARNSCDFYHSIPHKRSCIFFSILSAVITWITIIFLSSTVVLLGLFAIFSSHLVFNSTPLIIGAINCYIISLLVIAAISLACTITGTKLNNIFVSGIIMFFPRILIYVFINLISDSNPFLIHFDTFFLFKTNTNMLIGALAGFFSSTYVTELSKFDGYTVYTLILAIIYFSFAAFLFCKRKSESAGSSSVSNILQNIFRICIGIIVTIPSIVAIYTYYNNDSYSSFTELIFTVIFNFMIAAVIMFTYEICTTRKIKKSLKSLLFSPILIAVDAIIIVFLAFIEYKSLNFVPEVDEVSYICLYDNEYEGNYFNIKYSSIKIQNKEAIEYFVSVFQEDINDYIEDKNNFFKNRIPLSITFTCNKTEYSRCLYLKTSEYQTAMDKINSNINVNSIYLDFPSLDTKNTILNIYDDCNYSGEFLNTLYTTCIEEIKSNPEPYLNFMTAYIEDNYEIYTGIYFNTYINNISCYGEIPILPEYYDTVKMYIDNLINTGSDINNVYNILNNITSNDVITITFNKLRYSHNTFYNNNSYVSYHYENNTSYLPSKNAIYMFKEISTYLTNDIITDDYSNLYIITIDVSSDTDYYNYRMPVLLPEDFTFVEE